MKKLHEIWPGRNKFYFWHKVMGGPRENYCYAISLLLTLYSPVICYYVFCAHDFRVSFSLGVLAACTLMFYGLTAFTEPGILPRRSLLIMLGVEDADSPLPVLTEEQAERGWKFCSTCKILRPPRASHCADTDNCVLLFDHYCIFINQTIGARNYLFFMLFLTSGVLLGLATTAAFLLCTSQRKENTVLTWIVSVPLFAVLAAAFSLLCFHIYLNCSGKTTKEALRGRNGEDEGIQYNCVFRPNSLLPPYDISVLDDDTVSLAVIVPV
jgi:palmitoyltransferase ZDHHC9/14/18